MEALVERARAGDRKALEALLDAVAPQVHRFARRLCKNVHDADDVLQDTLVDVARHIGQFEGRSSFPTWVFTVARTACTRRRRGLANQPAASDAVLQDTADAAPSPEARAGESELSIAIGRALDALSEQHREAIVLRDVEGLSAAEAASVLGISVDALKSRLHRARSTLREALRPLLEPLPTRASPGCPDVATMWSRKLEDELTQADCAKMEGHIATCAVCSATCDALKRALFACRAASTAEVPADVRQKVKAALGALPR